MPETAPPPRRVERDVPELQLMVRRDNDTALAFWTPLGYDVVDVTVLGRRPDRA